MNFYQVITFFMCNRIRPFLSELLSCDDSVVLLLLTRPRKRPKPRVSVFHCHFLQCRVRAFPVDLLFYYRFSHTKLSRASIKIVPSVMGPTCFRPATKWATVTSSNYGQPTTTPKPPKTNVCCICETLKIRVVLKSITESLYWVFSPAFALSGCCFF